MQSRLHKSLLVLHEAGGQDVILDRLMNAVRSLIPGEFHACSHVDTPTGLLTGPVSPEEAVTSAFGTLEAGNTLLAHYLPENPLARNTRGSHARALRMSDFFTQRRFHDMGLYQDIYRKMRIEQVMILGFCPERTVMLAPAVMRSGSSFTDDERDQMDQLGAHAELAYQNATCYTQLERAGRLAMEELAEAGESLGLTRRQAEVMSAVFRCSSNVRAASELGVSSLTVKKHLENIYLRLGVQTRMQAVRKILAARQDA